MKFKAGDKVRVKSDLKVGRCYGSCYFTEAMKEYLGKEYIIEGVDFEGDCMLLGNNYLYSKEMLESIEEARLIEKVHDNQSKTDWSKVEVDTLCVCEIKSFGDTIKRFRYFAGFDRENNMATFFGGGRTSFTKMTDSNNTNYYENKRLATESEIKNKKIDENIEF